MPKGYQPVLPRDIHLKEEFAEFDATYQFKNGKLYGTRHLKTLMREVPASEREKLKKFTKTVLDDYGSYIPLSNGEGPAVGETGKTPDQEMMTSLRSLPDSTNEDASRLEEQAHDSLEKRDLQGSVSSLYRAVSADPKFTRAWVLLGTLLFAQHQIDAGMEAFHKAIALDPERPAITKALGFSLCRPSASTKPLRFGETTPRHIRTMRMALGTWPDATSR